MKKWIVLAIVTSLISVMMHGYLSKRSYELVAGKAQASSICNISEDINCDSALLSPYAKIFNVSVSNFGLAFNLCLAFVLFMFLFGMFNTNFWRANFVYLSGLVFATSLGFMAISFIENVYCPVCWSTYLLSLIGFMALFWAFRKDFLQIPFVKFIKNFAEDRSHAIFFIVVLILALFTHIFFVVQLDIKGQSKQFKALLIDWQMAESVQFSTAPLFSQGPEKSKMTVVEFADFTCPSCKRSHPQVKRFLETHKNVKFNFYVFPLDKTCNKGMSHKRTGLACELAKTNICAEAQNKGWVIQDQIFKNQIKFLKNQGNKKEVNKMILQMITDANLNSDKFLTCMSHSSTKDKLQSQIRLGNKVKIQGTPTFFVNGKMLLNVTELAALLNYIHSSLD